MAQASFGSHEVNNTNSFSSGTLQLKAQTPDGLSCYSTGSGSGGSVATANIGTCSGNPLPSSQLSSSTVSSATTTLSSVGTTAATGGTFSSASCGVAEVADSSSTGDTGLVYGGVTYGTSFTSPVKSTFTSSAISLNGNTGSYVGTTSQFSNPQTFSIAAWVKTTSANGGSIVGFADQQPNSASNYDRMLWVDNSGFVVFGVYPGSVKEVTSTAKVNDGSWHLVVATLSSSGMFLYLDSHSAISNSSVTSAQSYSGYWHLGWSPHSGWSDPPTDDYLSGSLAEAAIVGSALSSSNVSTLYNATSASSFATSLQSFSPTAYWPLRDSGTTPYTGVIPALGSLPATLTDATGAGNTATAQGGVTLGASGPLSDTAVSLNGASGSYLETTTSDANPGSLSQLVWFKAPASGAAGSLMGFTSTETDGSPSSWDRMLWIDATGHIVYGIYPGSPKEVSSPATYTDGNWHFAAASFGSAGEQLWIDGTEVASNASVTSAESYTGWWHIGFSNAANGWSDGPSSNYWNGSLAQAAVVPTQLTSSQISTLESAGTSAAFRADVLALSPTSYWPLDDSASSVCRRVLVDVQSTVGTTVTCLYPSSSSACSATPPSTAPLTSLTSVTMTPPGGSSVSILIRMVLSASSPAGVAGLHVLPPLQWADTEKSWSAQVSYASASVQA